MKIYLDKNLGVSNVEQEELTQDTYGYNILKVYIPNAVLTPYDTFTCYYGALLQNGRKVGWFAMEARTSTDADYKANYTLYKATLEQCVVSVEGKVYIGCQVLLGNSGNATLIKKNTAVVQFNVRKSVAINNDILVLDTDQTTTDVLESYKNLLENALTTYATKATTYTKTEVNSALALKADKSNTYTKTEVDEKVDLKADKSDTYTKTEVDVKEANLEAQMVSDKVELHNEINSTNNILVETNAKVASLETDVDTLQNNTYSKTEVDEKIDDISAYTKSEIDTMINAKADKTTVEGINTRVTGLQNDVADLKSVQNVVEVVATKSALNSYDTSKLDVNDKVQVISDESHDGASTIYNWNGSAWQYVGAFGGNSYTKAETYNKTQIDSALSDKADKSNTYTRAVIDSMVLTLSTDKADKSNTYTKTEIDNTMQEVGEIVETLGKEVEKKADKTTAVTHSGNQLKDYEGNNIYPNLSPDTVISNQDWDISPDSGWTNLANTRRFLINYGNDIPVNSKFSLSLQCYYSNNLEYTLLIEIWTNNNGLLNLVNQFTYTCPIHSPNGFYENIIIENMKNTYQYPLLITARNTGNNPIKYAQAITGNQLYSFSDLNSTSLNLSNAIILNGYNFRYKLTYNVNSIDNKLNSYVNVKKDGSGDYTTITEALENIPEGTPIIVYEGIYEENIRLLNRAANIRGVDKNKCIIKSKNGGYDYPTLYVKSGILKDLTIIAEYVNGESTEIGTSNGAYAVHVETEQAVNTTMEIDNCILKSDFSAAVGVGLRNNSKLIIRNSVLINNQISGRGSYENNGGLGALYTHDSMGVQGNSKLELYNNLFLSNLGNSLCIYHLPDTPNNSVDMILTNNVLKDAINGYSNNIWNRNNAFDYFSINVGYDNSNNDLNKYVNAVTLNNIVDSNGNTNVIATKQELNEKSKVVANPTLSGDEPNLEGAEIDGIKYKVSSGGGNSKLYNHHIFIQENSTRTLVVNIITKNNTPFTYSTLHTYIRSITNNAENAEIGYPCLSKYSTSFGYSMCCSSNGTIYSQNFSGSISFSYAQNSTVTDTITEVE